MAQPAFDTSLSANGIAETTMQSLPGRTLAGAGVGADECDFVSDYEFKMLMTLVVIATVAFGCIVNGWLM